MIAQVRVCYEKKLIYSVGNKYDIPVFCINDPIRYDLPKKKAVKKEELPEENIQVRG